MIIGFLSGGLFSKLSSKSGLALTTIVVIGIGIHILTQIGIVLNFYATHYVTWFIYGYFAQVTLVNYAILAQYFGPELSGRALTAVNILVFLFAFVVQYLFGVVVHYWPRITGSDIQDGFKVAFTALILLEILALVWFVVFRPKTKPAN
jgi:MFS family permease